MKTQSKTHILAMIAFLGLLALACNTSFSLGGDPAVTSITTCKAVNDDQACQGQTSAFDAAETIYASVAVENLNEGDVLKASWSRDGKEAETFSLSMDQAGSGDVSFSLIPEGTLPNGDYTVEVALNDVIVQTADFTVTGAVTEVGPITTCKTVNDNAECQDQADQFNGKEIIYASVFGDNLTASDEVKAHWFFAEEQIYDVALSLDEAGSFPIEFHLEPAPVLQAGDYSVQVLLNDEVVQTADFQVTWPDAQIISATTCKVVSDAQICQDEVAVFSGAEVIYVGVQADFLQMDDALTIRWFEGDEPIGDYTYNSEFDGSGAVAFNYNPDPATPMPSGDYRAELYLDDTLAETITFQVDNNLVEPAADANAEPVADGWQTLTSNGWRVKLNYPTAWEVQDGDSALAIFGPNLTLFYLTAFQATSPADEANQAAIDNALTILAENFAGFQSSDVEPFILGGGPGLTADYIYVDADGNDISGSIIVGTSQGDITYTVYIEALTADYDASLPEFNEILATLEFQ